MVVVVVAVAVVVVVVVAVVVDSTEDICSINLSACDTDDGGVERSSGSGSNAKDSGSSALGSVNNG